MTTIHAVLPWYSDDPDLASATAHSTYEKLKDRRYSQRRKCPYCKTVVIQNTAKFCNGCRSVHHHQVGKPARTLIEMCLRRKAGEIGGQSAVLFSRGLNGKLRFDYVEEEL